MVCKLEQGGQRVAGCREQCQERALLGSGDGEATTRVVETVAGQIDEIVRCWQTVDRSRAI